MTVAAFILHRRSPHLLLIAVLAVFLPAVLRADWKWENDMGEATSTSGEFKAVFTFHNTGTKPITVDSITSCCNCTVHSFKATTAAPGKSGTLTITIDRIKSKTSKTSFEFLAFNAEASPQRLQVVANRVKCDF